MNQEVLKRAMGWTQDQVQKSGGQVPDWTTYQKSLRQFLGAAPSGPFKAPTEYEYAYLRAKGMNDGEARARMGLSPDKSAGQEKKRGGFFRNLFS